MEKKMRKSKKLGWKSFKMNCSRQSKGLNSFKGVVDFNLHKDRDHMETTLEQGGNMDRGIELWGLDQVIEIAHMGVLE